VARPILSILAGTILALAFLGDLNTQHHRLRTIVVTNSGATAVENVSVRAVVLGYSWTHIAIHMQAKRMESGEVLVGEVSWDTLGSFEIDLEAGGTPVSYNRMVHGMDWDFVVVRVGRGEPVLDYSVRSVWLEILARWVCLLVTLAAATTCIVGGCVVFWRRRAAMRT
jgi:hypothetical protein